MTNITTKETKIVGMAIFIAGILAFITYYAYKGEVSVDVVVYCYIGSITFVLGAFGFALDPRISTVVKNIILLVEDIVRGKVTIDTAMERIKILIKTLVEIYNDLWLTQGKIKSPASTTTTTTTTTTPAAELPKPT